MPEEKTFRLGKFGMGVVTIVLWVVTAIIGLWEIVLVRSMLLKVYARLFADEKAYGNDYWGGVVLGQVCVVVLAVVWIGLVIGAGEYHAKYFGQPKSWRLFRRVIAVQLAILVLAFFI